jgi:hypothetical protein
MNNKETYFEKPIFNWLIIAIWVLGFAFIPWLGRAVVMFVIYLNMPYQYAQIAMGIIRCGFILFCLAAIVMMVYNKGMTIFTRLSIPLVITLLLVFIRYFYGAFYGENQYSSGIQKDLLRALLYLFVLILPLIVISNGISSFSSRKIPFVILLLFLSILCIYLVFHGKIMIEGYSMRSGKYLPFFKSQFFQNLDEISRFYGIYAICALPYFSPLCASLLLWMWGENRIRTIFFILLYSIPISCLYFVASRSTILELLFSHFVVFIFIRKKKNTNFYIIVFIMLLCNIFFLSWCGYQDKHTNIRVRFDKMVSNIYYDIGVFMNIEKKTNVSIDMEKKPNVSMNVEKKTDIDFEPKITPMPSCIEEIPKDEDYISLEQQYKYKGELRILYFKHSMYLIKKYPLTGYGLFLNKHDKEKIPSHCSYLDVFLGTGVFGGTLFLIIILIGVYDAIKCLRFSPESGWIVVFFSVALIHSIVWGKITTDYSLWFSLAALHSCVISTSKNKNNSINN